LAIRVLLSLLSAYAAKLAIIDIAKGKPEFEEKRKIFCFFVTLAFTDGYKIIW